MSAKVLVVDDERNLRKILSAMLLAEGYEVIVASNLTEAKRAVQQQKFNVVLTDLRLKGEQGDDLLKWIREKGMITPVIILTAHGTVDSAVEAMKHGAFDYLSKPFDRAELVGVIQKAVLTCEYQETQFSKPESETGFPMIGRSELMKSIFQMIEKVAPTDSTVLITGESGTGKELIAQSVHEHSRRKSAPFIKINCAAIPPTLMESELFGYEKGAFTGAVTSKPGRFELADGGTLFLDEIGEMSTEMQVKLLRVLQDGAFERVGGLRTIRPDVRLITATNKDLELEVKEGHFREDLFYRLNVVPVALPPLRQRPTDIPLLVSHFVSKFSERLEKKAPEFSPEALDRLTRFAWPGNIRQLENVIERLIVMSEGENIAENDLPAEILGESELPLGDGLGQSLKEKVRHATREIEKKAIVEALDQTAQNVTQAAKILNISRKGLQLKMKELGLR